MSLSSFSVLVTPFKQVGLLVQHSYKMKLSFINEIQEVEMTTLIVSTDPDIFGGTPVFKGTRVPVAVLFENLSDGMSLDEILDSYPTLSREAALLALKEAEASPAAL